MSIAKYPCKLLNSGTLPLPTKNSYQYQIQTNKSRSEMDLGIATVRRRTRHPIVIYSFAFRFNSEQLKAFNLWLINDLNDGVEWFYMPLLTENNIETLKCQFIEIPGENDPFVMKRMSKETATWEAKAKVQTVLIRGI